MIAAVIFDRGGVLLRTVDPAPRRQLEVAHQLEAGAAEGLVFHGPMGVKAQTGAISSAEHWAWIGEQLGLDAAGVVEFRQRFFAGDRVDEELVGYVRSLRGRYQTALLSNAMSDLIDVITREYPIFDAFDLVVGSAYEGIMKPAAEVFARTLLRLGRRPAEAVFVDDAAANVAGARAVGLRAVHYVPGMNVPAELARLGVRPGPGA